MGIITKIFLTGLTYAVLGALGLLLAIPPGYASPVFPAAGLAVAAVLCHGNRILPGVWLGSFLLNVGLSFSHGTFNFKTVVVAAMLGLGAMAQAYVAKLLIARWQPETWRHLETELDIALFMGITGPLACFTAATMGVTTLCLAGIVPPASFLYSWTNWWVGDTLGAMIFSPLVISFCMHNTSPWKERKKEITLPLIIILVTAVLVFIAMARIERSEIMERIERYGRNIETALDRHFVAHKEAISALSRHIEVSPDMTFRQFEDFTRITLQDHKDIFALSCNPLVRVADRENFEKRMRTLSPIPDFRITERDAARNLVTAAHHSLAVVVGFIAPLAGNLPAIGFDIYSDPIRRAAIDRALEENRTVLTAPIHLVQEDQEKLGVLLLSPSYKMTRNAPDDGQRGIANFAVGVIKLDEMIEIATKDIRQDQLTFHLEDNTVEHERKKIYCSNGPLQRPLSPFAWQTNLKLADRQWTLTVTPSATYLMQHRSWLTWTIGIVSLLFTALLQMMMLAMTGRSFVIRRKVEEQTAELTSTKEALEELNRSLQNKVDESIAALRKKDQIMIFQGRLAAMGEMIGAIAHQWRQPLNSLGLVIQNIKEAHNYGEMDAAYLERAVEKSMMLITHMSKTIDDFRNFLDPRKGATSFDPMQALKNVLTLFSAQLAANEIEVQLVCSNKGNVFSMTEEITHCSCQLINGTSNEFEHVLINLLNNSREAILEHRKSGHGMGERGLITITLHCANNALRLEINDNGGGVPDEMLERIFEPYFTTKDVAKGTGLGLCMSKIIVEDHFNGSLWAVNGSHGTVFTINVACVPKEAVHE
jgi:signal transduction histidine kinase